MSSLEWGAHETACDPRALEVADWLQRQLPDYTVLLFGSRARGDWHELSDIDLMILGDPRAQLTSTVHAELRELTHRLYGPEVNHNWFPWDWSAFLTARDSPAHLAGSVQRDGLNPEGRHLKSMVQNNPWPGIQEYLKTAQDALYMSFYNLTNQVSHGIAMEQAHHALENALKAMYAVHRPSPPRTHTLEELAPIVREYEPDLEIPDDMWLNPLTAFRDKHPYNRSPDLWDWFDTIPEIVVEIQILCGELATRILHRMGKKPQDVGYFHWWDNTPLGGMERVDPFTSPYFRDTAPKEDLQQMAEELLPPAERDQVLRQLETHPPHQWPTSRDIMNLRKNPPSLSGGQSDTSHTD